MCTAHVHSIYRFIYTRMPKNVKSIRFVYIYLARRKSENEGDSKCQYKTDLNGMIRLLTERLLFRTG